jgi:hypothetical protein
METRKRKRSQGSNIHASWVAHLTTAMEEVPFENLWDEFKTYLYRRFKLTYLTQKVAVFIQEAADKITTSAQSLEELCAAESQVVERAHEYQGIPTFGSILVTLGSMWRYAPGGDVIATWEQDRKALPEAYSYIPATLAETSMSHLLVYYMCYPRLSPPTNDAMIDSVLPWLVGRLYGKRGILWMLMMATHEQLHLPPSGEELNSWFQGALYGMMDGSSAVADKYYLHEVLSLSDPRVALRRSTPRSVHEVTQIVRDTFAFLPSVLIPHILDYLNPPKWLRDTKTLFKKVSLINLESCYVHMHMDNNSYRFHAGSWFREHVFTFLRGDVSCDTLREGESLWLEMPSPLQCSFGSILVDFAQDKPGHVEDNGMDLTGITDWDERRRQARRIHPDMDSFVPLHFASMSLTEVLWYYVRYHGESKVTGIQELVPWLVGHLYGIRGIFWMALLIVRLWMQPPKAQIDSIDIIEWIHKAMWSATGGPDLRSSVRMLRALVNKKRGEGAPPLRPSRG